MTFTPQCEHLQERLSLSGLIALDTVAPGGSHSAPIILEPITKPITVIVAVELPKQ